MGLVPGAPSTPALVVVVHPGALEPGMCFVLVVGDNEVPLRPLGDPAYAVHSPKVTRDRAFCPAPELGGTLGAPSTHPAPDHPVAGRNTELSAVSGSLRAEPFGQPRPLLGGDDALRALRENEVLHRDHELDRQPVGVPARHLLESRVLAQLPDLRRARGVDPDDVVHLGQNGDGLPLGAG